MSRHDADANDPFAEAGRQLQDLAQGPAKQAAEQLEVLFSRAGNRIGRELERAAVSGSLSFEKMVESILKNLARLAIRQVIGGALSSALGNAVSQGFGGARANGGPVVGNNAYLVGENGPEVFRPAGAGMIDPNTGTAPVTVNFHMGSVSNLDEFRRSSGQISAMLSRAVEQGRRRL